MMREFEDSTEAFEADEREALTEYEVWRQEQIAEQEAFEACIDSLIHDTPNEKQTMFLWCVFLVTLTYLNNSLLNSQSWY